MSQISGFSSRVRRLIQALVPAFKRRTISRRLVFSFGTTACAVLLAANWLNYTASRKALEAQINAAVLNALENTGRNLDLFIQKCGARCEPIISRELESGHCPPNAMRKFLVDLLARTPKDEAFDFYITYENMDYRDPDSDLVVDRLSWPKTYCATYDYHEDRQEWYHMPKVTHQPHLTEPYYDLGSVNQSMVSYTLPVLGASNEFLGVVGVDILLDSITNIVSKLDVIPGDDDHAEFAFVVSQTSRLISHPDAALLPSKNFSGAGLAALPEGPYVHDQPEGFARVTIRGEERRLYWATAPFTHWKTVIDVSQDAVMGPINALTWQIAGSSALALTAMIGMIFLSARRVSKPIRQLANSTSQLAAQITPDDPSEPAGDEIGRIGHSVRKLVDYQAELDRANRELESFSYSVSHDLRAPLRAIGGYTQILLEDHAATLNEEGRELCQKIRANTRNMGELISDLLNFSRLSRTPMDTAPLDMRALAEAAFAAVTPGDTGKNIEFQLGHLPPATGDAPLLRQVWINLLSNAVKFSARREHPQIVVAGELKGRELIYSVRDNGAGFDMQYAGKLFGVFQRLHSASEFEGTGVGLAIVQRVVHRHGGRVWAEGKPEAGATFYFALPSAMESDQPKPVKQASLVADEHAKPW